MLDHLSDVGAGYSEQKRTIAKAVGYESGPAASGSVTLAEGVTVRDLVDMVLGLKKSVPVSAISVADHRFGIDVDLGISGPGTMLIEVKPVAKALVVIRPQSGAGEVSWAGDLFSPGMPWLPEEEQRLRVSAGPFEILLGISGEANFTWEMPLDQPLDVTELNRHLAFRTWASEAPVVVELWVNGTRLTTAEMTPDPKAVGQSAYWKPLRSAFNDIMSLAPPERVPNSLLVPLQAVLDARSEILEYQKYVSDLSATITMQLEGPIDPIVEKTKSIISPVHLEFSKHLFVAVIQRQVTSAEIKDGSIILNTLSGRILRSAILKGTAEEHRDFVAAEVRWAKAEAAGSENVLSFEP